MGSDVRRVEELLGELMAEQKKINEWSEKKVKKTLEERLDARLEKLKKRNPDFMGFLKEKSEKNQYFTTREIYERGLSFEFAKKGMVDFSDLRELLIQHNKNHLHEDVVYQGVKSYVSQILYSIGGPFKQVPLSRKYPVFGYGRMFIEGKEKPIDCWKHEINMTEDDHNEKIKRHTGVANRNMRLKKEKGFEKE